MLSFSSKLFIPLVYLFITIPSLVKSHELTFNRRRHGFLKKRLLSDIPIVNLPSASSDSQIATSIISQSTAPDTSPTTQTSSLASISATSAISTSTGAASAITSSQSTSSVASSTSSSTATNSSSSSTSPTSQTFANINLTPTTLVPTASVVASTITSTQSLSATASSTATPQSASSKTKSTTVTILIAVAASVGGIAILWTIFRKWKLSSSKEFDRRLNPITDWQPTNGEDDLMSTLRRAPSSSSSFHSGGGSGDGHIPSRGADPTSFDHDFTAGTAPIGEYADLTRASSTNPSMQQAFPSFNRYDVGVPSRSAGLTSLDHDFTAGTAPIGEYADLARASNTNPTMQQALPSFNRGYDVGVPLHYQTGAYNGGSARY